MLDAIQEQLESIYGIRCEYRARDFLVDADAARQLGATGRNREELLVSQSAEGLELALFLDPALLEAQTLGDFCEMAEGVSHFVYMTHVARLERQVSLLELEAQAEVDKFAICVLRQWSDDASSLIRALFEAVQLRPQLEAQERWRYGEANRLAKTYCQRLLPLIRAKQLDRLLAELRHMYRLGAEAKLSYFAR